MINCYNAHLQLQALAIRKEMNYGWTITDKQEAFNYRRIPSKELDAKSTTPLAGRVITPTRPLPMPVKQ